MKKFSRWLLRQWHKLTGPGADRIRDVHRAFGKFRVLYPDGKRSEPMGYRTAKDYAEIFGGQIIDNF